eukprot:949213_1
MEDYHNSQYLQSEHYRSNTSNRIDKDFLNRPNHVISNLVHNKEYATQFTQSNIETVDPSNNIYKISKSLKHPDEKRTVDFNLGKCNCSYFITTEYPCTHMFGVIQLTPLLFTDLPPSLLNAPHMVLDTIDLPPAVDLPPAIVSNSNIVTSSSTIDSNANVLSTTLITHFRFST